MMIMICFLHPKGYQTQSAPERWGGGAINYDDDDDDNGDDYDDEDDDDNSDDDAKFSKA